MILDIARRRAELTPGRAAVFWQGRWVTYAAMNRRAEQLAGVLAARGLGKGARVGILALNHLAHLDLLMATAKLGIIYTPFNHRLSLVETKAIAAYVRPAVMLADAENLAAAEATGVPTLPLEGYEAALADAPAPPSPPPLEPEDIQMILFTGGTTGLPKGAMQPYRQGFYNAVNTILSWGLREDDCVVQATPCFHAALNAFTVPLYHLGARIALERAFEPDDYLRLVREAGATILFLVPTMYKMLADDAAFRSTDLSGVRWAISGGAPCPEPVQRAFRERNVRFKQGYGLTEAGVNCFAMSLDEAEAHPDSVGKAILHARAVVRREDGTPCAPGEVGELTLAGPHLFAGYFEREADTAEVLTDGWLWTGDLATMDAEGFVTIAGRRKEMFISGGENVFPIEIENALYDHPAVSECAVLGVHDARWGEVGLATVVPREGAAIDAEGVRGFLRERLARYKVPKHVRLLDRLPKSGAGKILKSELRRAFEKERAAHEGEEAGEADG
ncbi:MAG: AMP-binding protein [Deinococcales bacterium]